MDVSSQSSICICFRLGGSPWHDSCTVQLTLNIKHHHMNRLVALASSLVTLACAPLAQAVSFSYSNLPNTAVIFNGDSTFEFTSGQNFHITSNGGLMGLKGEIAGLFTIGAGSQTATVTGEGTFSITDGDGHALEALLVWNHIFRVGSIGGFNYNALVNLTDLTYAGSNAGLLELLGDNQAINTLTFQFSQPGDLDVLRSTTRSSSFSGSVTSMSQAVPDSSTSVLLVGLGLAVVGFAARRRTL
jgi:hypothetical protein